MSQYVAPARNLQAFTCPHCGVYAHQRWTALYNGKGEFALPVGELATSMCVHCKLLAVWHGDIPLYPHASTAPLPSEDMPEDVAADFCEARDVLALSPRSSAALLRLALQKLCVHLGEKGENINHDIGKLVEKGLSPQIQQAMDSVRVIGNNAVHPGEMDMHDNYDIALRIFSLLNIVVQEMITRPREIAELYGNLPQSQRDAIEKRDA